MNGGNDVVFMASKQQNNPVCVCVFISQISQRDILNSIEREMSGDLREGMVTVGKHMAHKQHMISHDTHDKYHMMHKQYMINIT